MPAYCLVLNAGSSSIKFKLFQFPGLSVHIKGSLSGLGACEAKWSVSSLDHGTNKLRPMNSQHLISLPKNLRNHSHALSHILSILRVRSDLFVNEMNLVVVGHRVVHGGIEFLTPVIIGEGEVQHLERLSALAPLHNGSSLSLIRSARRTLPHARHVAVFDTAFHVEGMHEEAWVYALPPPRHPLPTPIRKYGFHGTSYRRCVRLLTPLLGTEARLVIMHLGSGASCCAVQGGRSVDTSMGFTPASGLMMGTRSGDVDPAAIFHLLGEEEIAQRVPVRRPTGAEDSQDRSDVPTVTKAEDVLNHGKEYLVADTMTYSFHRHVDIASDGGLAALCGTPDLQLIESSLQASSSAARSAIDPTRARLALDTYLHRLTFYVGGFVALLGGVEALAFTGGVGENSSLVRSEVCKRLQFIGVQLNENKNRNLDGAGPCWDLSANREAVKVFVIAADEEAEIAEDCQKMGEPVVFAGTPMADILEDADVEHGHEDVASALDGANRSRLWWMRVRKKITYSFKPRPLFAPPFLQTVALTLEHFLLHLQSKPLGHSIVWPAHLLASINSGIISLQELPPNTTHSVLDRLTSAMLKHAEVWIGPVALIATPQILIRAGKWWNLRNKRGLRFVGDIFFIGLLLLALLGAYRISKARMLSLQYRQAESHHLAALRGHLDATQRLERAARRCVRAVAEVEASARGFVSSDVDEPSSPTDEYEPPTLCARLKRSLHVALAQSLLACASARHEIDEAISEMRVVTIALGENRDGDEDDGEDEDVDVASPRPPSRSSDDSRRARPPSRPPSRDGTVTLEALRIQLDALGRDNLALLSMLARFVRACRPLAEPHGKSIRAERPPKAVDALVKAWTRVSAALRDTRRAAQRAGLVIEEAETEEFRISTDSPLSASTSMSHFSTPVLPSSQNSPFPTRTRYAASHSPLLHRLAELDRDLASLRTKLYVVSRRTGERADTDTGNEDGQATSSSLSVLHGPPMAWRAFKAAYDQLRTDFRRVGAEFDEAMVAMEEERELFERKTAGKDDGGGIKDDTTEGEEDSEPSRSPFEKAERLVRLWSEDEDIAEGDQRGVGDEEVWEGEAEPVGKFAILPRAERIALAAARREEEARERTRRSEAGRMLEELKGALARRGRRGSKDVSEVEIPRQIKPNVRLTIEHNESAVRKLTPDEQVRSCLNLYLAVIALKLLVCWLGTQVKKWRTDVRNQQRELDRQTRAIQMEEDKAKRELQKAAKRGDKVSARMLAKQIVYGRKTRDRLATGKAQLGSIGLQLNEALAQAKLVGTLQKSAQLMRSVNHVISLPQISQQMRELQKEMVKAGVADEMVSEALDTVIDGADAEELEEEAEMEVDKVLFEVTDGLLGQALPTPSDTLAELEPIATEPVGTPTRRVRQEAMNS
ncbi:hypothetical protein HDU93_009946 [Gonapodya sp. JEL0774]|nr:hypothetical protein HDU93_009946 [Gonapodya sp. JEL0774]